MVNKDPVADKGNDDGFVLIAVIWIAGLLAVISTAFVLSVRSHTLMARNSVFNAKAEHVANGMTKYLALKLSTEIFDAKLNRSGATAYCQWSPELSVAWRIQDNGGLVDINTASPQLLAALFEGLGVKKGQSTANIVDFRDPDSVTLAGGAEPKTYDGKTYGPKNAPFVSAAELDQLPELDKDILKKLLPIVTTQSQQQGFDPRVAPEQLLKLLGASGPDDPVLNAYIAPSAQKVFEIDVLVESKQKARFFRKANIALQLQPDRPFSILSWERAQSAGEWDFPSGVQQACIN